MYARLIPNPIESFSVQYRGCSLQKVLQQNEVAAQMRFIPDISSSIETNERYTTVRASHSICLLNILGYIPGVSIISGSYRSLVGLAFVVSSAVNCLFDKANLIQHKEGLKIGAANFGRGLLEMIPVIGNLFALNIDISRMMHRWADCGYDYADVDRIPHLKSLIDLGKYPIIGNVTNLVRAVFFSFQVLVNIPPAVMTFDDKYLEAIKISLKHVGLGAFESIPILGNIPFLLEVIRNPYGGMAEDF